MKFHVGKFCEIKPSSLARSKLFPKSIEWFQCWTLFGMALLPQKCCGILHWSAEVRTTIGKSPAGWQQATNSFLKYLWQCYTVQKKDTLIICVKAQRFSLAWLEQKGRGNWKTAERSKPYWERRAKCLSKRCIWLYMLLSLPTFSCVIHSTSLHDLTQNIVQADAVRVNQNL